jgi:hypothetical protein
MTTGSANLKSKRGQKQKTKEPSLRDKLSANWLSAFEADVAENAVQVVQLLRQKSPEKYAEVASKLITATEPKPEGFASANSMQEIGRLLLKSIGLDDPTDEQIEAAVAANNDFIVQLEVIRDAAQPELN